VSAREFFDYLSFAENDSRRKLAESVDALLGKGAIDHIRTLIAATSPAPWDPGRQVLGNAETGPLAKANKAIAHWLHVRTGVLDGHNGPIMYANRLLMAACPRPNESPEAPPNLPGLLASFYEY
jgi:hypothetical protein